MGFSMPRCGRGPVQESLLLEMLRNTRIRHHVDDLAAEHIEGRGLGPLGHEAHFAGRVQRGCGAANGANRRSPRQLLRVGADDVHQLGEQVAAFQFAESHGLLTHLLNHIGPIHSGVFESLREHLDRILRHNGVPDRALDLLDHAPQPHDLGLVLLVDDHQIAILQLGDLHSLGQIPELGGHILLLDIRAALLLDVGFVRLAEAQHLHVLGLEFLVVAGEALDDLDLVHRVADQLVLDLIQGAVLLLHLLVLVLLVGVGLLELNLGHDQQIDLLLQGDVLADEATGVAGIPDFAGAGEVLGDL